VAQSGHFLPDFARFFDRSAATVSKNWLCLAKNGHFFVSDATTLTSYIFAINQINQINQIAKITLTTVYE
jgi:hypothetical protein